MNIIVCIKQVPGTSAVDIDPETGTLIRAGVDSKMNPYDLYALETALRLKAARGGKVTVLSMGPPQAESVIREAYAMGADDGLLMTDRSFAGADVLATAYTLSQGVRIAGEFDLIICGKQTTDGDTAQVGPEMSEYLGLPGVANVTRIEDIDDAGMTVTMDMAGCAEISRIAFPCLIGVDKGIYRPRFPSYLRRKATAELPVRKVGLKDLEDRDESRYGLAGSPTQVERIFPPVSDKVKQTLSGTPGELAGQIFDILKTRKLIGEGATE